MATNIRVPRIVSNLAALALVEPSVFAPDVMVLGDSGGLFSLEAGTTGIDGISKIASLKEGYLWQKQWPPTTFSQTLRGWASSESYQIATATYDADGIVSAASIVWPDGSSGTFTTTSANVAWTAVDAYTITHAHSGLTVTQAAVTRDADGNITNKPALTVA